MRSLDKISNGVFKRCVSKKIVAVVTLCNYRSRVGRIMYSFAKNNQPKIGQLFLDVPRPYLQRRCQATISERMGLVRGYSSPGPMSGRR